MKKIIWNTEIDKIECMHCKSTDISKLSFIIIVNASSSDISHISFHIALL